MNLGDSFREFLVSPIERANAACGLKRNAAATCVVNFLKAQAKPGGLLDFPGLEEVPNMLEHISRSTDVLVKLPATQLG